ncbi:MAG TPA: cupredoxin domain-containing protein [Candidatus Udaeobacter sp.]|nr:cupredoxin domain-containing protein [Candidatus Udaeobacter sp.]
MRKSIFIVLAVALIAGAALFVWKSKPMNVVTNTNKEFSMTAYYDPAIKKPVFSLPQMIVKKGDKVKVKVTNTMGMHDFTIDEFKIKEELPMNKEVVVEFTADKAGEFIYYCSKPGHRQNGQWGTLKVTE